MCKSLCQGAIFKNLIQWFYLYHIIVLHLFLSLLVPPCVVSVSRATIMMLIDLTYSIFCWQQFIKSNAVHFLSLICMCVFIWLYLVNFQWWIHESHESGLSFGALLLLAMRRELDGPTLCSQRRTSILYQMLRECVCQHVWWMQ